MVRKALCRDYAAMAPKARELQALSEENGFPSFGPFSKFFVGCALVAERRSIEDGLSLMREGLEAQRYPGPNVNRAVLLATLADSLNQVGEIDAGLVTVQRGFDIAEVGEVRYMHAELLRLQGELSRAQGPAGAAVAMSLFRDAIDVASRRPRATKHSTRAFAIATRTGVCETSKRLPRWRAGGRGT